MATVIKAGNVASGAQVTSDATGILQFNTGSGAGTTAMTIGTDQSVTFAAGTSINGITVGRGGGSVATNTAVGASALAATTGSSSNNTAVGSAAGSSLTSGARNTALGFNALLLNTTGSENTAVGGNALNKSTTPSNNTAVGYVALYETTTGANNTALGAQSLQNNTTASNNTAVGYQAGYSLATVINGGNGTFVGYQAGYSQNNPATGYAENTFVGFRAGYGVTTGVKNTFVGIGANNTGGVGSAVTTGNNNTIIGAYTGNQGGVDIRTSSNFIVLSDGDGNPRIYYDNVGVANGLGTMFRSAGAAPANSATPATLASSINGANGCFYSVYVNNLTGYPYAYGPIFGFQETGNNGGYSYQIFHGFAGPNLYYRSGDAGTGNFTGWYSFNITSVSDVRTKENIVDSGSTLHLINNVRVVDFDYKADSGYSDGKRHKGVIAQEEQNNISEVVGHVGDPDNPDTLLDIKYERYVPYLIKAMQELSAQVTTLQAELAALKGQA